VQELERFGTLLETLFKLPWIPTERLPCDEEELGLLQLVWPQGDGALASAWARLGAVDPSGGVAKLLRKRSRRAPMKVPHSGPELLLRAEFWRNLALARLREVAQVRLNPLQLSDFELLPATRWMVRKDRSAAPESFGLRAPRARLIEFADDLSLAVERRLHGDRYWERLEARARAADQFAAGEADLVRMRDNLSMVLRVKQNQSRSEPLELPTTLSGLVTQIAQVLGRKIASNSASPSGPSAKRTR
jgi:hypothetical protein